MNTSIVNISTSVNDLIQKGAYNPTSVYSSSFNFSNNISVSSKEETKITLASNSNLFLGASYNITNIFYNKLLLNPGSDYNVYSDNRKLNEENYLNCHYHPSSISYNKSIIEKIGMTTYVKYNRLGFGIDENTPGIKAFKFLNNKFIYLEFDLQTNVNFTKYTKFINVFLANQFLLSKNFLILQDILYNIYFFNLTMTGSTENISFFTKVDGSYVNYSYLQDAAVYRSYLILACNSKISILNYNNSLNTITSNYTIDSFSSSNGTVNSNRNIKSFLLIQKALYVSYEKFGLKILNLTSLDFRQIPSFTSYEFLHPNLNKLDAVRNVYNNHTFIGISILNSSINSEFFIELNAQNVFVPQFSKAFIAGSSINYNDHFTDSYYTYIFDWNTFNLIVLRRGRFPILDEYFNIMLDLSKEINNDYRSPKIPSKNPVWLFFDYNSGKIDMGIPDINNYNMFLIEGLTFFDHNVRCSFYKSGNYTLQFHGTADYCGGSLQQSQNSYCQLKVSVNFVVNIEKESDLLVLYIVLGILLFIAVFGVIFFFCCKFRCFRICYKNHSSQRYVEASKNVKGSSEAPDEVIEVQIEQK